VRAPQVYAIVEVGGDCSVADALQAHGIAAGGAEPDIFCLRAATAGSDLDAAALASSVAAAVELGACPAVFAVDGFDAPSLTRFVKALSALAPNARVAFNRVAFSVADAAGAEGGVLRACADLGVGVVAADPLGEGDSVTDARSSAHDAGMAQLLAFLGAMVGGGVQRSPAQVGLNWVMSKGATPEVATRAATRAWECGGAMLWRLDENAVGIVDERAAAAAQGLENEGKAVGA
jgi:aryl-alcohol dehydrogenase-like predicted oxidoreductase